MSVFGSSGNKLFEKLAEKATSPLQLEVDWHSILQMCDVIRQGDAQPKYAVALLKKKLSSDNINVLNYSLHCIESLVKNCGSRVHQEVATKEFMDTMKNIAVTKPDPVKTKVLELIQCWSNAFRKNPNYKIVEDYFNAMKLEGFQYPPFKESDSMFDVEQAPEWTDDTNCFRCRVEFSTFNRKHHCRCCGQIFCNNCSSKTSTIPKFGIEKEVRVCDTCYDKLRTNPSSVGQATDANGLPIEYLNSPLSKQNQAPSKQEKTDEEFEEELQLALALSQSEQEEKEKKRYGQQNKFNRPLANTNTNSSTTTPRENTADDSEAELNKFLAQSAARKAASLEKQSQQQVQISNPSPPPSAPFVEARLSDDKAQEHNDETTHQMNMFIEEVKKLMDLFLTRMRSDQQRGRTITNDTAVQSLFIQLQHMHPKLLAYIKFQEDARAYYESLQDKLTQLKDAREALNALRHDNFEKRRREAEERERIRQLQLQMKVADMRQKKHLYFKMQTEQNLQRLQEQERELLMRLEQQRHLVSMRDQQLVGGSLAINQNPNAMYSMMQQPNQPSLQVIGQPQYQQYQQQSLSNGNMAPNAVQMPPQNAYAQAPSQLNSMIQSSSQPQVAPINPAFLNQSSPYNMNALNMSLPQLNQPQLQPPQMGVNLQSSNDKINQQIINSSQYQTPTPQAQWQNVPNIQLQQQQQQQQQQQLPQTAPQLQGVQLQQPIPQQQHMQTPLQQIPVQMQPQPTQILTPQQYNTQLNQYQQQLPPPQQLYNQPKTQNEDLLISFD